MEWDHVSGTYWTDTEGGYGPYNIDETTDPECKPVYPHVLGRDVKVPPDRPFVVTRDKHPEFLLFCATLDEAKAIVLLLS